MVRAGVRGRVRLLMRGLALVLSGLALHGPVRAAGAVEPLGYGFFPARGEPRLLVVLVETPDQPHSLSPDTIREIIFGPGPGTASLAGYYEEVSYGALRVRGEVTPWLKVPKNTAQYAGNSYGINFRSWPDNMGGFATDSVNAALAAGIDLAPYDNDGDGHVDGLMLIHSGPGGEVVRNKGLLWSRVDYISMYGGEPVTAGGVVVDRFSVCAEYIMPGQPDVMRICAHEFGHMMGLPDLYDPDHSSFGIGVNGIMGILIHPRAMALPPAPCAYSRTLLDWTAPAVVQGETLVTLRPAAQAPDLVRINTPVPAEYFLLEYRAPAGADVSLSGNGLLLWHANGRAVYNNFFECAGGCDLTPRLALIQADGKNDLEHKKKMADPADFFPGPDQEHTAAGADTGAKDDPFHGAVTLTFSGLPSGVRVQDIKIGDGQATARVSTNDRAVPVRDYPWLVLTGVRWEEARGNGNGFAEPGEKMRIEFTLTNLGQEAKGITITPSSPGVSWSGGKARISGLAPGENAKAGLSLTVAKAPVSRAGGLIRSAFTDTPPPPKKKQPAAPAIEPGDTTAAPLPLAARFDASWFEPTLKIRSRIPDVARSVKARLVMGVPPVLVVNDAPHDLGPYIALALKPLKIPYATIDVEREGLPAKGLIAAPPVVLWLGGVKELDQERWPDPARLKLMEAVKAAGHVLIFSAARVHGRPSQRLMDLFGLERTTPGAGIAFAGSSADDAPIRSFFFKQPYPYYPDLNPHLILTPSPESSVLFTDFGGRATVTASGKNPMQAPGPEGSASSNAAAIFMGFPLEALKPTSISQLITAVLNHLAP